MKLTATSSGDKGFTPPKDMSTVKTILVCGMSGSGKSRFINTVTGSNLTVGDDVNSMTSEVTEANIPLVSVGGVFIQLVDSPGFDDARDQTEQPVFQRITEWLADRYRANARITGLIYLRPIYMNRIGRSEAMMIRMFKEICGEDCLDRVILVTNRWSADPAETTANENRELSIATGPNGFGSSGTKRVLVRRLDNQYTREDGLLITRYFWDLSPVTLKIQKEVVDEGKSSLDTAAGRIIGANLTREIHQMRELAETQAENNIGVPQNLTRAVGQLEEMRRPVKSKILVGLGVLGCMALAATFQANVGLVLGLVSSLFK